MNMLGLRHLDRRRHSLARALARSRAHSYAPRQGLATVMLLVAVLLAGLGTAMPAQRVEAASFPVTVKLTIEHIDAIGDLDPGCGQADFYANASVNGVSGTQGPIDGNDHPDPNWVFSAGATYDTGVSVPISIDLKEDDDTTCLGDDDIDINPGGGVG
ncbi:MAG TPA: hypothetical protein VFV93_02490, partial [Thermomicrobiales bacterium]|nr:hypothetical protein [Thermomicrobiales bacterium]